MKFQFNLELMNLKGKTKVFSYSSLQGKKHLLLFYHTQCLGCIGRAIPLAYQLQKSHPEIEVLLIHSNLGSWKPTKQEILSVFVGGESPLPIYIDKNAELYHLLNCEGTPHWIFLNEKAEIENSIFGSQANAQNRLMYTLDQL